MRLIDSKWVFRVKKDADGKSYRFKARLCARGFRQQEGIDFKETFSPMVRYDSLRVLLAIIAAKDLEVMQFDKLHSYTESWKRRYLWKSRKDSR